MHKSNLFLTASFSIYFIAISCGPKILPLKGDPIATTLSGDFVKKQPLTSDQIKSWAHLDAIADTVPGISLDKAYALIGNAPMTPVVVGVLDSGVDINHEDLKDVIWKNTKEIPGNHVDDDKNGFIDDVYGWNFLGNILKEQTEETRIVKNGNPSSPLYDKAKVLFDKNADEAKSGLREVKMFASRVRVADSIMTAKLGKSDYTIEEVKAFLDKTDDQSIFALCSPLVRIGLPVSELKSELQEGLDHFNTQLGYNFNLDYNGRAVLNDNPDDFSVTTYGDANVMGPDVKETLHGTHVAGIIAANRNNNLGIKGVAAPAKILVVRTIPDGDEYDKDVALSIRYAVDKGAKVINASFGKHFSPHLDKIKEAILYAASKDVLIVHAAGNESANADEDPSYPTDTYSGEEYARNFLNIGALSPTYGSELVANFSNYGKNTVDIFAPGVQIWSTKPGNDYEFLSGTSMASPEVAGLAALIRSLYPKLSAVQVKTIIIDSGLRYEGKVLVGGEDQKEKDFSEICKSGKIVNAYNAILLANKVARGEVKLKK